MRGQLKVLSAFAVLSAFLILGVTLASATAPTVSVDDATAVSYTSAHVSGEVDPQGQSTTYRFQFTPQAQFEAEGFENSATGPEATIEGPAEPVAGNLENLAPNTTYHLRLVAENGDGPSEAVAASTFTTLEVAAPTVTIDPPAAITGSSAHFSGQVDPNGADPAFNSDWHFECTPECPGLEGGTVSGSSQEVSADATGLKPGTGYEVSLIASNLGGQSSAGPEGFSTLTVAPEINSANAFPLEDEATLQAQINPGGLETSYFFEYGPTAAYGQSTSTRTIPAGGVPVTVKTAVFGLTPGSGYHFRVVASNSLGMAEGGDQSFTTQSPGAGNPGNCPNETIRIHQISTYLPECRAYEQVSPVDKGGAGAKYYGNNYSMWGISPDGNTAIFDSNGSFAGAGQTNWVTAYRSERTPDGWKTGVLTPAVPRDSTLLGGNMAAHAATPDLQRVAFEGGASYDPLDADSLPVPPGSELEGKTATDIYIRDGYGPMVWASRGNSSDPQTAYEGAAIAGGFSDDGRHFFFTTTQKLVAPKSGPAESQDGSNIYDRSEGTTYLVGVDTDGALISECGAEFAAMSSDGSRVLFRSVSCDSGLQELYLRSDNATTVQISRPRDGLASPESSPEFQMMSSDGRAALFTSESRLTESAPEGGGRKLYLWRSTGDTLEYLGVEPASLLAASADLSRFYFISKQQLADAPPPTGFGKLYFYDHGDISHIADAPGFGGYAGVETTSDGNYLTFASRLDFTHQGTGEQQEVYLYRANDPGLICVSCPGVGATPVGDASLHTAEVRGDLHNLTADGERLYFESPDQLTPQDANSSLDVYQFNSRTEELSLISSGTGSNAARFITVSPSGDDVLFGTPISLDPRDTDGGAPDLYDARVGGGFALPAPEPSCSGEACQGRGASSSVTRVAGSASLQGPSNRVARRSKKCRKSAHSASRRGRAQCKGRRGKKAHQHTGPSTRRHH